MEQLVRALKGDEVAVGTLDQCPERDLLTALLFDAIANYVLLKKKSSTEDKVRFNEVAWWIFEGEEDAPLSFEVVCEGLGLNPEYIRQGISRVDDPTPFIGVRRKKAGSGVHLSLSPL